MNEALSNGNGRPIKVLVVDDSPMMCKAIENILTEDEKIEVAAKALSGKEALKLLSNEAFDVCTLDVHMPGMNGLSVLKNIMVKHPLPTLMVSAFTGDGSRITFEALRFGAVDFFKKPTRNGENEIKDQGESLRKSLKRASRVQVRAARYLRIRPLKDDAIRAAKLHCHAENLDRLCLIYGSTGGYSSILAIAPFLKSLSKGPVIVSLEVSKENLAAFVDYLRPYCLPYLSLVTEKVELRSGNIYFIPADHAAHFEKAGNVWEMTVRKRPIKSSKEGAIDLTLLSASELLGEGLLSVFVSGDSSHGMTGVKEVVRNKGRVVAQDLACCLAPYNPGLVIEKFGADSAEPYELSNFINDWLL